MSSRVPGTDVFITGSTVAHISLQSPILRTTMKPAVSFLVVLLAVANGAHALSPPWCANGWRRTCGGIVSDFWGPPALPRLKTAGWLSPPSPCVPAGVRKGQLAHQLVSQLAVHFLLLTVSCLLLPLPNT